MSKATVRKRVCSSCGEEIQYDPKDRPVRCPSCEILYWDKPLDERVLFELQDEYYKKDRSSEVLGLMYERLVVYARNIIKKEIKNKFRMEADLLEEKASDLANKIIERYLKDPDYAIHTSFGGLMGWVKRNILYADAKEENHDSLNAHVHNGSGSEEEDELENTLVYTGFTPVFTSTSMNEDAPKLDTKHESVENLFKMILAAYRVIKRRPKSSASLFFIVGMLNKIVSKNENFLSSFYEYSGSETAEDIKKVELVMYNYLMEGRVHV